MKKLFLWCALLTKRLYKKFSFLAILALIPLLVVGYGAMAQEESGVMTVALAEASRQETVRDLFASLEDSSQLIRYVVCSDPEEAETMVRTGKADAALLFASDFDWRPEDFYANPEENCMVTVLVREDSTTLMLIREKISGALYGLLAQRQFLSHIRQENPTLPEMTDEEMLAYYHSSQSTDELFNYKQLGTADAGHYLMTPLRGMLAMVICLCGLAAAMYHNRDIESGTFCHIPARRQWLPELGCQLVAVGNVALVSLLALLLAGVSGNLLSELGVLVMYCLCVSSFCMLLRRVLGSIRGLAIALPVLVVVMLVVCPVFADFSMFRRVQLLLPPTFFVQGLYQPAHLTYMALHTAICATGSLLLDTLKAK